MKVQLLVEYEFDSILNDNAPDFGTQLQRQKTLDGLFVTLAEEATQRTPRKEKEITVIVYMRCLTRNVEWFNFNVRIKDMAILEEPTDEFWKKLLKHPRFRKSVKKHQIVDMMIPIGTYSKLVDALVDEYDLLMAPQEEIRQLIAAKVTTESA